MRASILAVCVVLAATMAWAEPVDDKKPETPSKPATAEKQNSDEVKVYTNKDLQRLFESDPAAEAAPAGEQPAEPPPPQPAASGGQAPPPEEDPLEWLKNRQQAQTDRQALIAEAQADVYAAEEKLANVKKELLATVNPFSARPQLSDEEKEYRRTSGETALERNERVKALEQEAQAAVDEARAKLERVKRQ